ncbi:20521_t:CDS:2 [Gigaspora margarita]|uniref:20521_t:CDS:1 n=1 Tax=Gigaspora margarita TaxID=4874 RepID=A0ABN7UKN7_GIGMA|nr:20521_t:CDS:2 [Gigaspora margarita]
MFTFYYSKNDYYSSTLLVKRKTSFCEQKKEICEKKRKIFSILNNKLVKEYSIQKTCISDIFKQSLKWLNIDTTNQAEASRKCECQPKWPKLDEAMHAWVESALVANMDLILAAFLTKAKVFAIALNIADFKENLQKFYEGYTLDNIWNAGEMALYWKIHPSKTLAKGPISGYKKEKLAAFDKIRVKSLSKLEEFTILDAINATSEADESDQASQQVELKLKETITDKVNNPMDLKEFVEIDANITFEMLSDNDIIRAIEDRDISSQQEEIEPLPKISDYDALKAFDLIGTYLLQQSNEFDITDKDMNKYQDFSSSNKAD